MWSDKVMESHMTEKKDYIKEDYRVSTQEKYDAFVKKRDESKMLGELADIAKKHGIKLEWTDYSDRTPDHYNVCRRGRWSEWNPLVNDVDLYELLLLTGLYVRSEVDLYKPLKELCEEIIIYRGEKNV